MGESWVGDNAFAPPLLSLFARAGSDPIDFDPPRVWLLGSDPIAP